MTSLRTQQANDTKRKIVEAALRCFSEKGYSASSTKGVAAEAGVSEGLIFHHFGTKERLLTAIFETRSTFAGEIRRIVAEYRSSPAPDCLAHIADEFVDLLEKESKLFTVLLAESRTNSGLYLIMRTIFKDTIDDLADYLESRARLDALRSDIDMKTAALSLIGSLIVFFMLNKDVAVDEWKPAAKHHSDTVLSIWLRGMKDG